MIFGNKKALPPLRGRVGVGGMNKKQILNFAKEMRCNPTIAEKKLWYFLRELKNEGYKFRRQHPFDNFYIVDFICLKEKLIIEIDGSGHNHSDIIEYDTKRTLWFEENGYRVLRFWNNDITQNLEGVVEVIYQVLEKQEPPP